MCLCRRRRPKYVRRRGMKNRRRTPDPPLPMPVTKHPLRPSLPKLFPPLQRYGLVFLSPTSSFPSTAKQAKKLCLIIVNLGHFNFPRQTLASFLTQARAHLKHTCLSVLCPLHLNRVIYPPLSQILAAPSYYPTFLFSTRSKKGG